MRTAVPLWLEQLTVGEVIGLVAGLGLALTVLAKSWRLFGRVKDVFDDLAGEPSRPGVPARPSLMERVATMEQGLAEVHHQTHPNSGGSIKDTVNRTEAKVTELSEQLHEHITHTTADRDALWKAYRDNHPEGDHDNA